MQEKELYTFRKEGKMSREEEIKKLEEEYFMLQMKDGWEESDYKFARELRDRIKKLKENRNDK